jgi:hypothetical protein
LASASNVLSKEKVILLETNEYSLSILSILELEDMKEKCSCQHNEKIKKIANEAFQFPYFVILKLEEFQPFEVGNFCINTYSKE